MRNEIELAGCAPEPLMSYLKALGIFRLVAEQEDADARLFWRGGTVVLHTKLDRDGLARFFLERYKPTPIVGPWGARSGFYPGSSESTARSALETIVGTSDPRFASYRRTVQIVRKALNQLEIDKKDDLDTGDNYLCLLRLLRNELPDEGQGDASLDWFEAVCAITLDDRRFPPLLGTGGNEGSGSYVSTFAQLVGSLLVHREFDNGIRTALYDEFDSELKGVTVGHFNPGALGGPNATQGMSGGGGANPWDYLLGIEGTLLFSGSISRRLGSQAIGKAVFPFCVDPVAVGYASESEKESANSTRAEMWLPLWSGPFSLRELKQLFAEGRAALGRRQARNSVEFALAISTLGVSRGLSSFVRYAFVMRYGLSYFAAPLGRIEVILRPEARLLDDPPLRDWIDRLRRACSDKDKTPTRYQSVLRNIDRTMFTFACRSETGNDGPYLLEVLRAIGQAERTMAHGLGFAKGKYIRPLAGLSSQWLEQANNKSSEFRLAASVAGICETQKKEVGRIRVFLEEVEATRFVNWNPGSTSAVWSKQSLANNLASVFRCRQMEAYRSGISGVPINSACFASLDDVIAFLNGHTDDEKIADLLWGMICIDYPKRCDPPDAGKRDIPFEFGIPRLLVNPHCFAPKNGEWCLSDSEANAKPDPDVFHHLMSGQSSAVSDCVTRAARRLKSDGLLVAGYRNRRHSGNQINVVSPFDPIRLLASMLFPLSNRDLERIANSVLYPVESEASHVD